MDKVRGSKGYRLGGSCAVDAEFPGRIKIDKKITIMSKLQMSKLVKFNKLFLKGWSVFYSFL